MTSLGVLGGPDQLSFRMKILYHCPDYEGGLAEYSRHQAAALAAINQVEVMWHAPEALPVPPGVTRLAPLVRTKRMAGRPKAQRAVDFVVDTLAPYKSLSREIERHQADAVLLSSWSEYFAPLWAPKLRWWRKRGVRFGAVIQIGRAHV